MAKVYIELEDVFEEGKKFGDCLNDMLDFYYTSEGAEAPMTFCSST